jgi:hypothetical protein
LRSAAEASALVVAVGDIAIGAAVAVAVVHGTDERLWPARAVTAIAAAASATAESLPLVLTVALGFAVLDGLAVALLFFTAGATTTATATTSATRVLGRLVRSWVHGCSLPVCDRCSGPLRAAELLPSVRNLVT